MWTWWIEKERIVLGLRNFKGIGVGIIFSIAGSVGVVGVYLLLRTYSQAIPEAVPKLLRKVQEFGLETPAVFILFMAFLSIIHSFLEEYYWRWFVFGRLTRQIAWIWAACLSSLAFMAFHVIDLSVYFPGRFWQAAVPLGACVGVGGGFWCWLYHRSGSIVAPWISHLMIDVAIMAVGYGMVFGSAR